MASLIFAQAKAIRRKAKKDAETFADLKSKIDEFSCGSMEYKAIYAEEYEKAINRERAEFKEILHIAAGLHQDYLEVMGKQTNNWYFITVRPDTRKITFDEFFLLCQKYVHRKCFHSYTLSFEQKGTDVESLGTGFHCHIVADCSWRSKGEALRDTTSTFNKCTEPQCIEIKTTRNPDEIVQKYLCDYESKDEHKASTKEWDTMWRLHKNIKHLYTSSETAELSPSSPEATASDKIIGTISSTPVTIDFS